MEQKKEYQPLEMKVIELKKQSNQLLSSSDYSGPYGSVNQTESSSVV